LASSQRSLLLQRALSTTSSLPKATPAPDALEEQPLPLSEARDVAGDEGPPSVLLHEEQEAILQKVLLGESCFLSGAAGESLSCFVPVSERAGGEEEEGVSSRSPFHDLGLERSEASNGSMGREDRLRSELIVTLLPTPLSTGSGKSVLLRAMIAALESRGKTVGITATTGIAAQSLDSLRGRTIHGWSG